MTDPTRPLTAAGEALLASMHDPEAHISQHNCSAFRLGQPCVCGLPASIRAIEDEAHARAIAGVAGLLAKYGHHLDDCAVYHQWGQYQPDCTCGFTAALAATPPCLWCDRSDGTHSDVCARTTEIEARIAALAATPPDGPLPGSRVEVNDG